MLTIRLPNNKHMIVSRRSWWMKIFMQDRQYLTIENMLYVPENTMAASIPLAELMREYAYSKQQNHIGYLKWFLLYYLKSSFRYDKDIEACSFQVHYTFGKSKKLYLVRITAERLSRTRYGKGKSIEHIASDIINACSYQDFIDYLN